MVDITYKCFNVKFTVEVIAERTTICDNANDIPNAKSYDLVVSFYGHLVI